MKALSLHQPYATLIAYGFKEYETRSWKTDYRGDIAIHAALKRGNPQRNNYNGLIYKLNLYAQMLPIFDDLPFGKIVLIANLSDCILMTPDVIAAQTKTEIMVGDWSIGRYAWKLDNLRAIKHLEVKGRQSIWTLTKAETSQIQILARFA